MKWFDSITLSLEGHLLTISISIGLIILYLIVRSVMMKIIRNHARRSDVSPAREVYIRKILHIMLIMITITILGASWEISLQGLSFYFASIFTVIGIGLFATWSILSNLTSSIILFFFFPYRIGHKVKIIDGDNSVEGIIEDITFFYIKIKSSDKKTYSYPNNLAIQKPIRLS